MAAYDPDDLVRHYREQALRGLASAARDAEADMRRTRAHGNVTGATRASYRAYAVGPGAPDESGTVGAAVSEVARLNPGAEALRDYSLPAGTVGVVLTGFTDYLPDLQVDNAGQRAVLLPTLIAFTEWFIQSAAEGK